MNSYNKKRLLLGLCVGLFMAVCLFAVSLVFPWNKQADVLALELDEEIKEVYDLEEEFFMPNARLSNGTTTVEATDSYIIFPDNTAFSGADFSLDQVGLYTLVFSAEIDGVLVKESKEFVVKDKLYETSDLSAVEYSEELSLSGGNKSGIEVNLLADQVFTYNKPININKLGNDTPIICLYNQNGTTKDVISSGDKYVQNMYVRLTDCYNPSRYLEIYGKWNAGKTYFRAKQNHQFFTGIAGTYTAGTNEGPSGSVVKPDDMFVEFDGGRHWVVVGGDSASSWGTGVTCSSNNNGYGIKLYFDNESKRVFAENSASNRKFVTDLDETAIYENNLFQEFTNGDVFLSVYGTRYNSGVDAFKLQISEIGGEQVVEDNVYIDQQGPEISVEGYDGELVGVAMNEPFKVFNSTALDPNGIKEQKVAVFYNYGTENQIEFSLKDGYFTPTSLGNYVIEYTAKDFFGAQTVKTVTLNSQFCANNTSINLEVVKQGNVPAGTVCTLSEPRLNSINGGEYYSVYLVNKNTGEKTLIENNNFVVDDVGVFEIVYEYGDKYSSKTYSYEFTSTQSSNVIITAPSLPDYIIANYFYTFDLATVDSFETGSVVRTTANVFAREDGGEYKAIDLANFKISSTQSSKVQFKFEDSATAQFIESEEIPVINVKTQADKLQVENYFQGDVTKLANSDNVTLTANASGDVKIDFINSLALSNFKIAFSVPSTASNFERVRITLTDYYNRKNVNELEVVKVGDTTCRLYHGNDFVQIDKSFLDTIFTISYVDGQIKETISNGITLNNEFTSERLLLSITLVNVSGQASISVSQIANQVIKELERDTIAPDIILKNNLTGIVSMGTVANVVKVETVDVFSPSYVEQGRITVYGVKNEIVTSVDGVRLKDAYSNRDYQISLDSNAIYKMLYWCEDQEGNYNETLTNYRSVDTKAPSITLNDTAEAKVIQAKVGETVKISGYTVSDNCSDLSNVTVFANVVTPISEKIYLPSGTNSFVPDRTGLFTVKYMAVDEAGNYATTFYYVLVK